MVKPWRTGKALALPTGPFRHALVLGLWKRLPKKDYQDWLGDEQWLRGHKLDMVEPKIISTWDRGPDEDEAEEVLTSQPGAAGTEGEAIRPQ